MNCSLRKIWKGGVIKPTLSRRKVCNTEYALDIQWRKGLTSQTSLPYDFFIIKLGSIMRKEEGRYQGT